MAKKIIMDVDTGSDDSIAIMAAMRSPDIELVAICAVGGARTVANTTENSLRVLDAMGVTGIPVYSGCNSNLVRNFNRVRYPREPKPPVIVNGIEYRMHDDLLALPPATTKPQKQNAVSYYIDLFRNTDEEITIVATGPLTNLACALSIAPDIAEKIHEIVIMGGGDKATNASLAAESNLWQDPEAGQIVLNSGAKIVLVPLDCTHTAYIKKDEIEHLRSIGTFEANYSADLTEQRMHVHNAQQPLEEPDCAPIHDAFVLCYVIDPSLITEMDEVHVDVGFGGYGDGHTIIDRNVDVPKAPNCLFARRADREAFRDMLYELFTY